MKNQALSYANSAGNSKLNIGTVRYRLRLTRIASTRCTRASSMSNGMMLSTAIYMVKMSK